MTSKQRLNLISSIADSNDTKLFSSRSLDHDGDEHYRYKSNRNLIDAHSGDVYVANLDEFDHISSKRRADPDLVAELDRDLINEATHIITIITHKLRNVDD